jgi:DMSO/TMAO reductase YedYZ molybdopterin-dependent catalytic subunit
MLSRWHTATVPDRIVVTPEPLNAETPLGPRTEAITPVGSHYVRTHFPLPVPPRELVVDGAVRHATRYDLAALRAFPSRTVALTLECAGNGRAFLEPPAPGEPWRLGAVGTAQWTGVDLRDLVDRAKPLPSATELLFRGADSGRPKELDREIAFERSLPVAEARADDVLVAYAMNGEPLALEHGAPWRLVVPGRYGMASVKWLARITALEAPFAGFYQRTKYVIDGAPLPPIAPRAVIVEPADGAEIAASLPDASGRAATVEVRGYAWSGNAELSRVEVSMAPLGNSQRDWREATLGLRRSAYAWREFSIKVLLVVPGSPARFEILARAIDASGEAQPLEQRWNALGYMNNQARGVRVRIV